jgi:hypothetical protein
VSRPWRRAALVAAGLLTAVLLAGLCLYFIGRVRLDEAKERFVATVGPLEMPAYQPPDVPTELNAARWLEAGAEALVLHDGDMDAVHRLLAPPIGETLEEDREAVHALIDRNGAAFDLLGRSAGLIESSFGVDYSQGFEAAIPSFLDLRKAAQLVRADSRLALLEGDAGRLARDAEILDQYATTTTRESILVSVLFGLAADRSLLRLIHDVVDSELADTSLIADLARRLEDRDRTEALRRSFAAEGAMVASVPPGRLLGEDESWRTRAGLTLFEPFQVAGLLDGWADLATALDRPWAEIKRDFATPEGEPRAAWDIHFFMLPNILSAIERLKANNSSTFLARSTLELWASYLSGDEFPDGFSFETDDPYTGEPFRYELHEDGSVNLVAPGAEAQWLDTNGASRPESRPIFNWKINAAASRPATSL